jgi:hypothetical protein
MTRTDIKKKEQNLQYRHLNKIHPSEADLVFDFFVVFSRFEFVLKRSGFLKGNEDKAEPDWDKFCNKVSEKFDKTASSEFQQACEYYTTQPPKKQIVRDGDLVWKENVQGKGESEFRWIIRSVKTVRNNLFHGGKFPYSLTRDTDLLFYGLVILHVCMKYDKKVEEEFTSGHM